MTDKKQTEEQARKPKQIKKKIAPWYKRRKRDEDPRKRGKAKREPRNKQRKARRARKRTRQARKKQRGKR